MWVRMIEGISGGRHDGSQWPRKGGLLEVEDWEGRDLIKGQLALPAAPPPPPPQLAVIEDTAPSVAEVVVTAPASADDEAPAPTPSDPKSAWVEYAVSKGANQGEAENLTKAQLQSAFGGRLLS